MNKFFKFVGSVTLLCATVAGGIFAYKKFFAPDPFEDDLEDSADEDAALSGRGYVSLTSESEEEAEEADKSEEVKEAAEEEASETEA